jgi:transcription antitermination factor NusG
MNPCLEEIPPPQPWVALVVAPRCERKVQRGLEKIGIETFVPWHGVRRRWSDRMKTLERNLFPGYVFCRSAFSERLSVLRQAGVRWVVSFDRGPAPIPDSEILALRRALQSETAVDAWPFLPEGERVRIEQGALAGLEGTLVRDSTAWRVVISIQALQRSVAVQVDRDMICVMKKPVAVRGRVETFRTASAS